MKRTLLINPTRDDGFVINRAHVGLSLIGELLMQRGYTVKVVDYAFLRSVSGKIAAPPVASLVRDF